MTKILFVCHGNICRSPMAEYVMKHLVAQAGQKERWEIASCATSTEEIGNPVYPPAKAKLAEYGIGCKGHSARQMTRADYDYYDMIVAMDHNNLRNMRRFVDDDPMGKVSLLLEHLPEEHRRYGCDVADPWYTGNFDATYSDVLAGCEAILKNE